MYAEEVGTNHDHVVRDGTERPNGDVAPHPVEKRVLGRTSLIGWLRHGS